MAKRRKGISDKRVNTLLRRINRIRSNYKTNREYLQAKYGKMLEKSAHFERTALREDIDIFDINYEIIMANPKSIKTNKKVRQRAEKFIQKYQGIAMYRAKTTERRISLEMRDEWLEHFKAISGSYALNMLEEKGLMNNTRFWRSFFNSKYFIPLYKKYTSNDKKFLKEKGLINKNGVSIWDEYLIKYIEEWERKHE